MEPTEEQYLILNALDTLDLVIDNRYDEDTGLWYIYTFSQVLPFAMLRQNGDITSIQPVSEL